MALLSVSGEHDGLKMGRALLDLGEHFQAAGVGQADVEQQQIRSLGAFGELEPLRGGARGFHAVAVPAEQRFERQEDRPLVVDNENPFDAVFHHGCFCSAPKSVTVVVKT